MGMFDIKRTLEQVQVPCRKQLNAYLFQCPVSERLTIGWHLEHVLRPFFFNCKDVVFCGVRGGGL